MELEILDAVAALCEEHNIEWFLSYGSALGAARHQGFIPWDDDIDIAMLRPDYDRFIQVAKQHLPAPYCIHIPGEDPHLATTFAKVCKKNTRFATQEVIDAKLDQGIFIDITPYDRISNNEAVRTLQKRKTKRLRYMLFLYHSAHVNFLGKSGPELAALRAAAHVAHAILKATCRNDSLQKKWDYAARLASSEETTEYASFHSMYDVSYAKDVLVPVSYAEMAGRRWPVPGNLDAYLQSLYGNNWHEIPPVQQRRNHAPLILDFGDGINAVQENET